MGCRFLGESRSKGRCERVSERSLHFADNAIGSCRFVQQFYAVPNEGDPHTNRNALYQLMNIPVAGSTGGARNAEVQLFCRNARATSRATSRFFIEARLSWAFLPRARPTLTFMSPRLVKNFNGMSVQPALCILPIRLAISLRFMRSLRS